MTTAVLPGSFDPPTYGHLSIIKRASRLFDSIDVLIAVNPGKNYMFTAEERIEMLTALVGDYPNVQIHTCDHLVVDYAKKIGAKVLLRGVRNTNDFGYELDLSMMNHALNNEVDTIFIPTEQQYVIVKSSSIKELAQFGGDISGMVPPIVADALHKKFSIRK
ncbi:MAG: pantetheine-phosphate adenylyltransferase [Treponema sp.]|nr:pantetheine-phosphate adenylyltransferase [Treponema sp.]